MVRGVAPVTIVIRPGNESDGLEIPQPWGTAAAVPIGYPQLRGHGPISRRPAEEMAFIDTWERPFA
jgi:hypothetical protein